MKYTVIGDPHLTNKNSEIVERLFESVELMGNKCIWLGDMLDTKEVIRGKALNQWLDYFKNSKLEHIVLVGNHDYFNLDCEDHSLKFLKTLDNVKIVDSLFVQNLQKLAFIPYIHDEKVLKETIKSIPKDYTLFGHLELKGFDFGNGHICDSGLTSRSFTKFKSVISGHFHKYQTKGNLTYLGTPFSHSFGESNQDKFLGIFDTESSSLELVPTGLPQHITYTIDCAKGWDGYDINPSNQYRAILEGTRSEVEKVYEEYKEVLEGYKFKVIKKVKKDNLKVSINSEFSNKVQFNTWAKKHKKLDPKIINLGNKILEKLNAK